MKKIWAIAILAFSPTLFVSAQDGAEEKIANTITSDDLKEYLSVLASDALQGRETGTIGQKMAATYIAEKFKSFGLTGPVAGGRHDGYFQDVIVYNSTPGKITLTIGKETYTNFSEVMYYGSTKTNGDLDSEVILLTSKKPEDIESLEIKGKSVLLIEENRRAWRSTAKLLRDKGAKLILVVSSPSDEAFDGMSSMFKNYLQGGSMSLEKPEVSDYYGVYFLKPSIAGKVFNTTTEKLKKAIESNKSLKPGKISFNIEMIEEEVLTENVLGYLEGTDKKDELLVITSHYDHLGKNGDDIYNGADDDGSGTVGLIELAQAFSEAKKQGHGPHRSILFMTVTGEEKGLLGSDYYTQHPIFPLENTISDLNLDMVGRIDDDHQKGDEYVCLVGSDKLSTELHQISEDMNSKYTKLELDYTYNDENHPERIYYRSDHWNFAKNNIPVIFYTTGSHPDYHKPTDTVEKIEYDLLRKRTQLVFYTAWELVNRNERITVDKAEKSENNQ